MTPREREHFVLKIEALLAKAKEIQAIIRGKPKPRELNKYEGD